MRGRCTVPSAGWSSGGVVIESEHCFESSVHRSEFLAGVLAGEVSLKFAHAGSAASTHDTLARSSDYRGVTLAVEAEARLLVSEFGAGPLVLFDVGSGNGDHGAMLLDELARQGVTVERLVICDFAVDLLALAVQRIGSAFPDLPLDTMVWDIESGPSDRLPPAAPPATAVLMLLGQTLGNPAMPGGVLRNLRESTAPASHLLISVSTHDPAASADRVLAPYRAPAFEAAVLEPFIALGIPAEALRFRMEIEDRSAVGTVRIDGHHLIDSNELQDGHSVRCFRSRRFSGDDVVGLIESGGWAVTSIADDGESHLVVLSAAVGKAGLG